MQSLRCTSNRNSGANSQRAALPLHPTGMTANLYNSRKRTASLLAVVMRSTTGKEVTQESSEYLVKYPAWEGIQYELTQKYNIKSVPPQQVMEMVQSGEALLVDVRPKETHEESRPEPAVNAPAFRIISMDQQSGGVTSMLKFAVMKFNGVTPTEANPEFPNLIQEIAGDQKVILACTQGGTLSPSTTFPAGKVSRSLKACWRLLYNDAMPADRVLHLDGGVKAWEAQGFPMM